MSFFSGIINNDIFIVAFVAWFIAQLIKVILTFIKDRKLDASRLIGSGGFPSSHTSFVMGMSTAVGLKLGFDSLFYAISLTMSLVVMYDASGVRRAVGKQAEILNAIIEDLYAHKQIGDDKLKELIGHTPFEVLAGALLGIIVANIIA